MDIIDKIKKLIALGTNNTNEKEMALALAKAADMAIKNNLDINQIKAECDGSENNIERFAANDKWTADVSGYQRILWTGLAGIFGCKAIIVTRLLEKQKRVQIQIIAPCGLKETILYLGVYLGRCALESWKKEKQYILSMPSHFNDTWRKERYLRAFSAAVVEKTERIFKDRYQESYAMVVSCGEKVTKYVESVVNGKRRKLSPGKGDLDTSDIMGWSNGLKTNIFKAINGMEA